MYEQPSAEELRSCEDQFSSGVSILLLKPEATLLNHDEKEWLSNYLEDYFSQEGNPICVFPVLIELAVDVDAVTRQLYAPLVVQLIHWFTKAKRASDAECVALLDAVVDAVAFLDPQAPRTARAMAPLLNRAKNRRRLIRTNAVKGPPRSWLRL